MQFTRRGFVTGAVTAGILSASTGPTFASETSPTARADWMIDPSTYLAEVLRTPDGRGIALSNGLVRRAFCLNPNVATIAFDNLTTDERSLRSIRPEAIVTIDNYELPWVIWSADQSQTTTSRVAGSDDSRSTCIPFDRVKEGKPVERFPWRRIPAWSSEELPWPPPGRALTFHYEAGPKTPIQELRVRVHYELYDGIPLMAKWINVENRSQLPIQLNSFKAEVLAILMRDAGAPPELDSFTSQIIFIASGVETGYPLFSKGGAGFTRYQSLSRGSRTSPEFPSFQCIPRLAPNSGWFPGRDLDLLLRLWTPSGPTT